LCGPPRGRPRPHPQPLREALSLTRQLLEQWAGLLAERRRGEAHEALQTSVAAAATATATGGGGGGSAGLFDPMGLDVARLEGAALALLAAADEGVRREALQVATRGRHGHCSLDEAHVHAWVCSCMLISRVALVLPTGRAAPSQLLPWVRTLHHALLAAEPYEPAQPPAQPPANGLPTANGAASYAPTVSGRSGGGSSAGGGGGVPRSVSGGGLSAFGSGPSGRASGSTGHARHASRDSMDLASSTYGAVSRHGLLRLASNILQRNRGACGHGKCWS
jgi:hypothetical protein